MIRTCALTRTEKPVEALVRFAVGPDDVLVPDVEARAGGRGVWITLSHEAVSEAVRKKAFARSLKGPVTVAEDLAELTELRLRQRLLSALGMARKAGQFVTGATKVKGVLQSGQAIALLTAKDAAEDGRNKMLGSLRALNHARREAGLPGPDLPHFELLQSAEMDLALGLENVIHAALTTGAAAQSAVDKAMRLARYSAQPMEGCTDRNAASGVLLPADQDERR
ncbi:RNA-binding protein [Devosia sp. YIM 151766]|uniref:RNA-binding protein n=1 Tax=Devosia sp. YIM 151766 TaxID=3017325 RepID=UPI00255C3A4D|nr:RNA-binding protein [Devosia sp. YIM 151766]WIY52893.1 RNA-binding protein [Devosia sp. YIM 151766]